MIGVILNPHAGYVARHGIDHVRALITAAVPVARIHMLTDGDDVGARCRDFRADGAACIVAAGGDGTVGSVAAQLVGIDTPLGVLAVGTLNHFARDVGVGRDVPAAARTLATGRIRLVDAAEVNGHLFVNNSSIGLYAHLVETRERHERQWATWLALVRAALLTVREGHPLPVRVSADGATGTAGIASRLCGCCREAPPVGTPLGRGGAIMGVRYRGALPELDGIRGVHSEISAARWGAQRRPPSAPRRCSTDGGARAPLQPHRASYRTLIEEGLPVSTRGGQP